MQHLRAAFLSFLILGLLRRSIIVIKVLLLTNIYSAEIGLRE